MYMNFQCSFIILILTVSFTFNITELECKTLLHYGFNKTFEQASETLTEYPFGLSEVLDDASNVFGTLLGKFLKKKKILGIESFYDRD